MTNSNSSNMVPPLVIQIGFAGARSLVDMADFPDADPAAVEASVREALGDLLRGLPGELKVQSDEVLLCGISQIAIGADIAFTEACGELGILQRIFLPQHLDAYFAAVGGRGPDFEEDQRRRAERLLGEEHIIETRLVSDSHVRHERFRDVNLEIIRESDVLICVVRKDQRGSSGGTHELLDLAGTLNRPTIILEVSIGEDNEPMITRRDADLNAFEVPRLPPELAGEAVALEFSGDFPNGEDYCAGLQELSSRHANTLSLRFKWAALLIVGGHVLATFLALVALKLHSPVVPWLLGLELLSLGIGLWIHHNVHVTHSTPRCATFRVLAELASSVKAIGSFPVSQGHLFSLPFDEKFDSILRTVSVLQMRDSFRGGTENWQSHRDTYTKERLTNSEDRGQISYHERTHARAEAWLSRTRIIFYATSFLAIVATTLKLLAMCDCLPLAGADGKVLPAVLGVLAVALPVIAVAALSLATAFDLEAREGISSEMVGFLTDQVARLKNATDAREYQRLLIETETRLLGETANWFARRSYVGVS